MMMLQDPVPPVPPMPPEIPFDPNLLLLNSPVLVMIVFAALTAGVIVLWPIMRALGRRLEGRQAEPALREEVEQLHRRLGEMDGLQHRVSELEERLDFAERLLTRGQEPQDASARSRH